MTVDGGENGFLVAVESTGKFDALATIEEMEGEGNEYQVKVVRFLADNISVLVERLGRLEERVRELEEDDPVTLLTTLLPLSEEEADKLDEGRRRNET